MPAENDLTTDERKIAELRLFTLRERVRQREKLASKLGRERELEKFGGFTQDVAEIKALEGMGIKTITPIEARVRHAALRMRRPGSTAAKTWEPRMLMGMREATESRLAGALEKHTEATPRGAGASEPAASGPAPCPASAAPTAQPATGKAVDLHKQQLDTRACGALAAHPGWSDKQIAAHLKCSRTSLYRLPGFTAARKVQKMAKKENLRRGHWDRKRGQAVPYAQDENEDEDGREVSED